MALILVVEDDKSMNDILVETLTDEGHDVQSVFTGKDAVRRAQLHDFELVVSDVRLPGLDGVETLAQIRKDRPNIKCIIITGYASADTPVRAMRMKVDDYLFKPFSLDYFLSSVERTLHREEQKASKFALVQKVFSLFGRSKDASLVDVVAERQEAFRGLYLGCRSGYLTFKAASEVYNRLEHLEENFRGLLNATEVNVQGAAELQSLYTELINRISALELNDTTAEHDALVPEEQMRALYDATRSSQIGLDDLQYAPLLRKTPDQRFETLKELLDLKHQLWPELKSTSSSDKT